MQEENLPPVSLARSQSCKTLPVSISRWLRFFDQFKTQIFAKPNLSVDFPHGRLIQRLVWQTTSKGSHGREVGIQLHRRLAGAVNDSSILMDFLSLSRSLGGHCVCVRIRQSALAVVAADWRCRAHFGHQLRHLRQMRARKREQQLSSCQTRK